MIFTSLPSRVRRSLITGTLLSLLASIDARAADWVRFRGPNGSGIAPDAKPATTWSDTQNVRWKTELPGPGASSPIIVGGRVFLTCYSGYGDERGGSDPQKLQRHLVCVNRADGNAARRRPTARTDIDSPLITRTSRIGWPRVAAITESKCASARAETSNGANRTSALVMVSTAGRSSKRATQRPRRSSDAAISAA